MCCSVLVFNLIRSLIIMVLLVHTKFEIGTEFSLKYYCLVLAEIVISSTVLYQVCFTAFGGETDDYRFDIFFPLTGRCSEGVGAF